MITLRYCNALSTYFYFNCYTDGYYIMGSFDSLALGFVLVNDENELVVGLLVAVVTLSAANLLAFINCL